MPGATLEQLSAAGKKKKGVVSPHNIEAKTAKKLYIRAVISNLQPLIEAEMSLALGHKIETEDGTIYQKSPDGSAIKNILDRAFGKATEKIELESTATIQLSPSQVRALAEKAMKMNIIDIKTQDDGPRRADTTLEVGELQAPDTVS